MNAAATTVVVETTITRDQAEALGYIFRRPVVGNRISAVQVRWYGYAGLEIIKTTEGGFVIMVKQDGEDLSPLRAREILASTVYLSPSGRLTITGGAVEFADRIISGLKADIDAL